MVSADGQAMVTMLDGRGLCSWRWSIQRWLDARPPQSPRAISLDVVRNSSGSPRPCRGYVEGEPDLVSIWAAGVEPEAVAMRPISGHNIIIKSRQAGEHVLMRWPGRMVEARLIVVRPHTSHTTGMRGGFTR